MVPRISEMKHPTGVKSALNLRHDFPHRGMIFTEWQAQYPNCHLPSVKFVRNILTSVIVSDDGSSDRWQLGFSKIPPRHIN